MPRWFGCLAIVLATTGCRSSSPVPETTAPPTTEIATNVPIVDADAEGDGRAVAYVSDVGMDGDRLMATMDFARLLTGPGAEQAARAAGDLADGDALPNDFYISNTDPTATRLEIDANAEIDVQGCFEDGACPTFVPVTRDEWFDLHTGSVPATLPAGFTWYGGGLLYGIAMEDGVVTTLIEQYLP